MADRMRGGGAGQGAGGSGRPDDRSRQRRTQRPSEAQGAPLLVREDDGPHLVPVPAGRVDRRQPWWFG
ncbi:hypothetical protein [Streptomyces sp. CA2R106]|uniref:hypothetical protein n=1 Tax=Streptomyces sp. CA2R106 TaxID=3120153 RepID=UPI0030086C21